jgi:hypothetical protein
MFQHKVGGGGVAFFPRLSRGAHGFRGHCTGSKVSCGVSNSTYRVPSEVIAALPESEYASKGSDRWLDFQTKAAELSWKINTSLEAIKEGQAANTTSLDDVVDTVGKPSIWKEDICRGVTGENLSDLQKGQAASTTSLDDVVYTVGKTSIWKEDICRGFTGENLSDLHKAFMFNRRGEVAGRNAQSLSLLKAAINVKTGVGSTDSFTEELAAVRAQGKELDPQELYQKAVDVYVGEVIDTKKTPIVARALLFKVDDLLQLLPEYYAEGLHGAILPAIVTARLPPPQILASGRTTYDVDSPRVFRLVPPAVGGESPSSTNDTNDEASRLYVMKESGHGSIAAFPKNCQLQDFESWMLATTKHITDTTIQEKVKNLFASERSTLLDQGTACVQYEEHVMAGSSAGSTPLPETGGGINDKAGSQTVCSNSRCFCHMNRIVQEPNRSRLRVPFHPFFPCCALADFSKGQGKGGFYTARRRT